MKMDMDLKDVVNAKVFGVQIWLYLCTYDMSGTYKLHRGNGELHVTLSFQKLKR